jgi:hypothetical protein
MRSSDAANSLCVRSAAALRDLQTLQKDITTPNSATAGTKIATFSYNGTVGGGDGVKVMLNDIGADPTAGGIDTATFSERAGEADEGVVGAEAASAIDACVVMWLPIDYLRIV